MSIKYRLIELGKNNQIKNNHKAENVFQHDKPNKFKRKTSRQPVQ